MKRNESRMTLSATAMAEVQKVQSAAVAELLEAEQPRANVVGVGTGVKWKNGQPTGEQALIVLVTHKVAAGSLPAADLVPARLQDMQTDVLAIGYPFAGDTRPLAVTAQTLAQRARPAEGGYSVGHVKITAGT